MGRRRRRCGRCRTGSSRPTASGDHFLEALANAGPGITCDQNLYSGPGQFATAGNAQDLAAWRAAHAGWDAHSLAADAMLADPTEFGKTAAEKPVYDWSKAALGKGSPGRGAGVAESGFTTDFTGAARKPGAYDMGAIAAQ
jgi:hypothetical protein